MEYFAPDYSLCPEMNGSFPNSNTKQVLVIFMYGLCLVYICLVEDSEEFFVSEKQQEEMIRTKSIRVADDHHGYLNAPRMFRSE